MRLIDNILFIEWSEASQCGFSENTLKSAKLRNSPYWNFVNDPDDRRKVLIGYEQLKDEYKEKVKARFGNPYDYMAKMPVKNMVKYDLTAEQYYMSYKYDGNKILPIEHVRKYATAASWLNMLKEFNDDKKALKKLLNLTIEQFYIKVMEIFKTDSIDLPTSYRRLMARRIEYEKAGYECLIDWRFGNRSNAAKINDELSEAMLLQMLSHHNQFDGVFVALQYNKWAVANGYKIINAATVGEWKRRKEHLIIMDREGNAALKGKYLSQVKGTRPSFPLALIESDDNNLDWLFIEFDRVKGDEHSARYVAIVVLDSFNDYVLGYAYAQELTTELVRIAYLNAMYHIREVTGNWYLPHETKTDRWAVKTLKPFYAGLGHYFETPVGSKNRGYIENFFGSAHWKRCMKAGANNYTGNNITARTRGVNMEVLASNKKERPLIGNESVQQVESFFHNLRYMPEADGKSRHEKWLNAWQNLSDDKKKLITDEQFLLKVGFEHLPKKGELPRISNRGLEFQINNIRYSFDIEGGTPIEHIGKEMHVFYDPYDMSRVLITDHENVRLMGLTTQFNSRAMADHTEGSHAALNMILEERKSRVTDIITAAERRKQVLETASFNAETALKEGVMIKEIKQKAERIMLENSANNRSYDPYEQM